MRTARRVLISTVAAIVVAVLLVRPAVQFWEGDNCADMGGGWNAAIGRCDGPEAYVPLIDRPLGTARWGVLLLPVWLVSLVTFWGTHRLLSRNRPRSALSPR
jgi:hypothetical protein